MQEFVLVAERTLEFRDYVEPALEAGQVRVRAVLSGIKHGTEMALYQGKSPFMDQDFDPETRMFRSAGARGLYPCNLGSWVVAEVIEVGPGVTRFAVGDRVHGAMPHRPTNVVPQEKLFHLGALHPERAIFTDPAIFALVAAHDAQIKLGDHVAIFGLGAIGLLAVQMAKMSGARTVFAIDLIESRLALARAYGADVLINPQATDAAQFIKEQTGGKGVDVAIEITGAYAALQTAIRSLRPAGTVVTVSFYKGAAPVNLGGEWHHNRLNLVSSMPVWGMPHRSHPLWDLARVQQTTIGLLEGGRLQTEGMVSRRYPYAEAAAAYQMIDQNPEATIKTILDY